MRFKLYPSAFWPMTKTKLPTALLTTIAASVMASQWGYAAEPVPVTSEMMQLVHDEHDLVAEMVRAQLAEERERYKEPRTAINATSKAAGMASVPRQGGRTLHSAMRGRGNS
jgi:hypothetical protein